MAIEFRRTRPYSPTFGRLLDQAFAPIYNASVANGGSTGYQSMPVNVWETNEGYHAALLVPGLNEETVSVTVHENVLNVEGELSYQAPEGARMLWQEFSPAKFRRSLRLGSAIDATRVEAMYRNGLLLVTLPKAEHAKPRHIQVQSGAAPAAAAQPIEAAPAETGEKK
jgi:HSP20 family protein